MWIHEHRDWPNFYWDDTKIGPKLVRLHKNIKEWKQSNKTVRDLKLIHGFKDEDDLNLLAETAIKTSNIEGEYPNENEVRISILKRINPDKFKKKKTSGDINGLVDMVMDANWNFETPLSKERIWKWHKWLFPQGYSGLLKIRTGGWRFPSSNPMRVLTEGRSWDGYGEVIHYEAPHGDRLEEEMDRFLNWIENEDMDLLLKSGVAHIWFEFIHPLEDGNGRVGRALCDLLLARASGSDEPFHNLTGQIATEVDNYYNQLGAHGRVSSAINPMDITNWLDWFLDCLERSMDGAKSILEKTEKKMKLLLLIQKHDFNERQWRVIHRMLESEWKGHMNLSKFVTIGKCNSQRTASRDIADLNDKGIFIENSGGGRNTSYRLLEWEDIEELENTMKEKRKKRLGMEISTNSALGKKTKKNQLNSTDRDRLKKLSKLLN